MKISVCITVFNEAKSISNLLSSLLDQTHKADEIILVDGGSKDRTIEIARHFQGKDRSIRILVQKCTRAEGRNIAVDLARNEVIAMIDAGCVADKNWLKNISQPLNNREIDVAAGFYKMVGNNSFAKAASIFLGTQPNNFDINFLPSTRSIAFKKAIWEKVGGFPENLKDCAEDTVFNYKLLINKAKFTRVKNAFVEWGMPKDLKEFFNKIYKYAKGDVKSGIWFLPNRSLASHNIHSLFIILRYLFLIVFISLSFYYHLSPIYWILIITLYIFWAFRKTYQNFHQIGVGIWGIILQFVSDLGVIAGFAGGLIKN